MTHRRPRWSLAVWLLLSHLGVGLAAVVVLLLSGTLDDDLRHQTEASLRAQADLWALDLQDEVARGSTLTEVAARAEPRLAHAKARTLSGIQIVDADATVIASAGATHDVSLHDAPEVRAALAGAVGHMQRPRPSAWQRSDVDLTGPSRFADVRSFVAVPVVVDGRVHGAVVVSRTPRGSLQALVQIGSPLLWRVLALLAFAIVLSLTAGHYGSRSLRQLVHAARAIAAGAQRPPALDDVRRSRVDEVRRVADAVDTMGSRLRARMDDAEAFAGNAAHQFRTPIATLRGTMELLRDDPSMPAAQRDRFLHSGIAELLRLDALVGGLLQLGRARRLATDTEVDLDTLLRDAARTHDVPLRGHAGFVVGNAAALHTIATNLLENARRHGGPHVRLHAWRTADEAGFAVEDDGPGIPEALRPRIFQRFFTTHREHGVGLGLPVVRELVTAHGGTIALTSTPGRTRFAVALPVADGDREGAVPRTPCGGRSAHVSTGL